MKDGFTCECGKAHKYSAYVAAHWRERLLHTCDCGAKHSIREGIVKLVKK
jgi:hypothetical protein